MRNYNRILHGINYIQKTSNSDENSIENAQYIGKINKK